mgnify:CR=1 FL=1
MAGTLEIKRRIKSIRSTKKITRAMQMVSAAKMRKAQDATLASRSYSYLAWHIISNLSSKIDPKYHKLLQRPESKIDPKKIGIILITSNRGLIGGFNANLNNVLKKYIEAHDLIAEFVSVGKKGREILIRTKQSIIADFPKHDKTVGIKEIEPISEMIVSEYLSGKYEKIVLVYTHFVSTINQKPVIKQILPFTNTTHQKDLPMTTADEHDKSRSLHFEYTFEPTPDKVLEHLIPRILESQIYQAILESDASEHSARMIMMKNATDAATELVDDLTFAYNQLRQANITKELSEITAGRIALE